MGKNAEYLGRAERQKGTRSEGAGREEAAKIGERGRVRVEMGVGVARE